MEKFSEYVLTQCSTYLEQFTPTEISSSGSSTKSLTRFKIANISDILLTSVYQLGDLVLCSNQQFVIF